MIVNNNDVSNTFETPLFELLALTNKFHTFDKIYISQVMHLHTVIYYKSAIMDESRHAIFFL